MSFRKIVAPGQSLGFVNALKAKGSWPLSYKPILRDDANIVAIRPFLVVAATPGDLGIRPLSVGRHQCCAITLHDVDGHPVTVPVGQREYFIHVRVLNLGGAASYSGAATFYVNAPQKFDQALRTGRVSPLALKGFVAPPNGSVEVICPRPWRPANDDEAKNSSIVVHASDTIFDHIVHRFDASRDRHVGRRDPGRPEIPDFSGTWVGVQKAGMVNPFDPQGEGSKIKINITQKGLQILRVSIFSEDGFGAMSVDPYEVAPAQTSTVFNIVNRAIRWEKKPLNTPGPIKVTSSTWSLSLPEEGHLKSQHEQIYSYAPTLRGFPVSPFGGPALSPNRVPMLDPAILKIPFMEWQGDLYRI